MELLVAIIILGTMISLAIPRFTKTIEQSYEKQAALNLLTVRTALTLYKLEHNGYPSGGLNDVTAVNDVLGLGIIANNMTYRCTNVGPANYDCQATSPSGWRLHIASSFINGDPHCSEGMPPCPTCTTGVKCPFLP